MFQSPRTPLVNLIATLETFLTYRIKRLFEGFVFGLPNNNFRLLILSPHLPSLWLCASKKSFEH